MRIVLKGLKRWNNCAQIAAAIVFALIGVETPGYALLSFNGVSGFDVQDNGKTPIITLKADMPVRYELQTVNPNQVKLTLYQVQFTQNLMDANNKLRLSNSHLIQQASVENHPTSVAITLTGPDLSKHLPTLAGDIIQSAQIIAPVVRKGTEKQVVVFPTQSPTEKVAAQVSTPQATQTPEPAETTEKEINEKQSERIEIEAPEPAAPSKQKSNGPSIIAATDVEPTTANLKPEAFMPSMPDVAEVHPVPEPKSFTSHGPKIYSIQAITLNEQGQPVQLLPKNAPISTIQIGQPQHVYNALFQDEVVSPADQLMSDALTAYHQNQLGVAEQTIQKALQLKPDNDEFLATLAEIQIKQQKLTQACESYRKAVNQNPGQYEVRYAQALSRTGKRADAIHMLENALQLDPQNSDAIYMLGTLNEELGNSKAAIIYLEQAASLSPQSADILYNLGLAYEFSGNFIKAKTTYQKALALNPSASDITTALQRVQH